MQNIEWAKVPLKLLDKSKDFVENCWHAGLKTYACMFNFTVIQDLQSPINAQISPHCSQTIKHPPWQSNFEQWLFGLNFIWKYFNQNLIVYSVFILQM